jgi:hypothetical protein
MLPISRTTIRNPDMPNEALPFLLQQLLCALLVKKVTLAAKL